MATVEPFDPFTTYVELADDGAARPLAVTPTFWADLKAGRRRLEGRLLLAVRAESDMDHWERHPAGEELVLLLSGAVDFLLETKKGVQVVPLERSRPCLIVPRGLWHRFRVRAPAELLFLTAGAGTEHRSA